MPFTPIFQCYDPLNLSQHKAIALPQTRLCRGMGAGDRRNPARHAFVALVGNVPRSFNNPDKERHNANLRYIWVNGGV